MDSNTQTKFIIVTGANKGIGLQIVKDLLKLEANYSVILTSRDTKRGLDAVKAVEDNQDAKGRLFYENLDIESDDSINSFTEIIEKKYKKIYALVNNAGVQYEIVEKIADFLTVQIDEKSTKSTLAINVRGTIKITQKIIPFLDDYGRIVFLSSLGGCQKLHQPEIIKSHNKENLNEKEYFELLAQYEDLALKKEHMNVGYHNSIYIGSKLFLNTYIRSILKQSLKTSQTAFAVHPGIIKTDMGTFAETPVEQGTISTLKVFGFSDQEAQENNLQFFNETGNITEY